MESGWIKLHKKSIDSTVFQNEKYWYVWSWCLMKANYEDAKFQFNGMDIMIKRGQFITGRESALREMPAITAQKYKTAIKYLKLTSRITSKVTNRFTIITICNYDDYQTKNEQANQPTNQPAKQPLTNHQPTTNHILRNKELKELKEEKNFFSEKVSILFNSFLKTQKNITDTRIDLLVENLENLTLDDDELKIEIIKQAISGGHSDFRPIPVNAQKQTNSRGVKNVNAAWGRKPEFITDEQKEKLYNRTPTPLPPAPPPKAEPPTFFYVRDWFVESGFSPEIADKFYSKMHNCDWTNSKGADLAAAWQQVAARYFGTTRLTDDKEF